jgi:hypothetical protein
MTRQTAVRNVAARVPAELRSLRAKLMLESLCEALGVEETACPACRGSGWLDRTVLARCPLCVGFREVPERLAVWFGDQMLATSSVGPNRAPQRGGSAAEPEDRRPPDPGRAVYSARRGRLAERVYRVLLPANE